MDVRRASDREQMFNRKKFGENRILFLLKQIDELTVENNLLKSELLKLKSWNGGIN